MKIFRTIDFETTGLPSEEERHAICEAGWCDVLQSDQLGHTVLDPISHLVDPGRPMPVPARAIHHISDAMVKDKPSPDRVLPLMMQPTPTYFVAHNIDHEKQFFSGGEIPWLCTYKSALRVWTDAPGHKVQELRYFLNIDDLPEFDPALAERPHRAPDDAYVTAFILIELLKAGVTLADMEKWSKGPALLFMCFMKAHKNKPWSDVPPDYLDWIYGASEVKDRDVRATAKFYLMRAVKDGRYTLKHSTSLMEKRNA